MQYRETNRQKTAKVNYLPQVYLTVAVSKDKQIINEKWKNGKLLFFCVVGMINGYVMDIKVEHWKKFTLQFDVLVSIKCILAFC